MNTRDSLSFPEGNFPSNQSRLLRSLPSDLYASLQEDLESVYLNRGDVLMRVGEPIDYVYFPTECLLSLVVTLESGSTVEAMTVGVEGFLGTCIFLGDVSAEVGGICQIPGEAQRMPIEAFVRHLQDERLRLACGAYARLLLAGLAQSIACMAFHSVPERLARWLLIVMDNMQREEFNLTHEFLAGMLGVHRPTVSLAMEMLVSARVIDNQRGLIRILDPEGLKKTACECYRATVQTV